MILWINGTIGSGKSAVGHALATMLSQARFVDGDDHAGPPDMGRVRRWQQAHTALLGMVAQRRPARILVVAYPLRGAEYARLRIHCGRARRRLTVLTLAPPLATILRGRGGRTLDGGEQARVRKMHAEGYHRRRFSTLTLPNAQPPAARTAWLIMRWLNRAAVFSS
jgi:hypothetical protein